MQSEEDLKRCARCEGWLPRAAFAARLASPDGLQHWCRTCSSEWALENRSRKRKKPPQVADGQKWCRRCDSIQSLEAFGRHRGLKDGRQTYCRRCTAELYRARRERSGHLVRPSGIPEGYKFCRTCETVKPLAEWSKNASASDGLQTRCKACVKLLGRRDHLKRSYGLSPEDVAALLRQQQGFCLICLRRPAAHVDHDHETGAVRGCSASAATPRSGSSTTPPRRCSAPRTI